VRRFFRAKVLLSLVMACCFIGLLGLGGLWAYAGPYPFHVLWRHGGTYWINVDAASPRLSPSMRLALRSTREASPGDFQWRAIAPGFEVAELPVMAAGQAVDSILLARIDPVHYRFAVRNASAGDKNLDEWMTTPGVVLVVNGSYFGHDGKPDTPFLSDGALLGPRDYDAKAGAFVASREFTGIRDLAKTDWRVAFQGADNAMVSYPLLLADGVTHVPIASRWLANRSFVGQDKEGRIIIGTTTDAFFSLTDLARFLRDAPLGLTTALNLDGGPVACQGISLNGYKRKSYGRWESQVNDGKVRMLTWPYGTVAMPVVLAVFPR
jgi:hypothetical protein